MISKTIILDNLSLKTVKKRIMEILRLNNFYTTIEAYRENNFDIIIEKNGYSTMIVGEINPANRKILHLQSDERMKRLNKRKIKLYSNKEKKTYNIFRIYLILTLLSALTYLIIFLINVYFKELSTIFLMIFLMIATVFIVRRIGGNDSDGDRLKFQAFELEIFELLTLSLSGERSYEMVKCWNCFTDKYSDENCKKCGKE